MKKGNENKKQRTCETSNYSPLFVCFSHVHAAYASFLWETEEDEDGDDLCVLPSHFQNGAMASATA